MADRACSLIFPTTILTNFQPEKKSIQWWGNQTKVQEISIKFMQISTKETKGEPQSVN
jgi:hypothetical protein